MVLEGARNLSQLLPNVALKKGVTCDTIWCKQWIDMICTASKLQHRLYIFSKILHICKYFFNIFSLNMKSPVKFFKVIF